MKRSDGDYIDVPYRPDAVLVNLGAQMQIGPMTNIPCNGMHTCVYYACTRCNTARAQIMYSNLNSHWSYVQCHDCTYYIILLVLKSVLCMQPHRVLLPDDEVKKRAVRQCVTFFKFLHPDNDVLMECIDGIHPSQQRRLQTRG